MKIVQISDTHNSHLGGLMNDNLVNVIELLNTEIRPDFVIHSGDVSILDPDVAADRETARNLLSKIDAPLWVLPGNHDVGEPGDTPWAGIGVTSERVSAFRETFGPDHRVEIVGDWALIGFNSEIIGSGLPEEAAQWEWFETVVDTVGGRPALVFSHKPILSPTLNVTSINLSISPAHVERLEQIFAQIDVKAYGSGHLHHFSLAERDAAQLISAPSTAFVHRGHADMVGPGIDELGFVEYRLEDGLAMIDFIQPTQLVDAEPNDIPAFSSALDALGVTL